MRRAVCVAAVLVLAGMSVASAQGKVVITDPSKVDEEYRLQGEYLGRVPDGNGCCRYVGLQVIALGDGRFEGVLYVGGLPGGGWNRKEKSKLAGQREDAGVKLYGEEHAAFVDGETARLMDREEHELGTIGKVHRISPTAGAAPPWNAIVMFDGSGVERLENATITENGNLGIAKRPGILFKDRFKDFRLHVEFRLPYVPHARGQGRGNSGVYLNSRYEVQILDSFGLEGKANEAGGLYRQREPDVNMAFPPLRWQTYDIDFTAPRFDDAGNKVANARITVRHNGVLIHDDVELTNKTGAGSKEGPDKLPIKLQHHGNPVVFRNVWIVDEQAAGSRAACCRCVCR